MKKYVLIIPVILLTLFACKEEDNNGGNNNNPTPQPTKKELLTAKSWKYQSWTVTPPFNDSNNNPVSDYLNYLRPCERDNIFTFMTNGLSDVDNGPSKCDANDPQHQGGTWFFANNETEVNFGGNVFTILKLTSDSMKWTFTDVLGSTTHTHVIGFKH